MAHELGMTCSVHQSDMRSYWPAVILHHAQAPRLNCSLNPVCAVSCTEEPSVTCLCQLCIQQLCLQVPLLCSDRTASDCWPGLLASRGLSFAVLLVGDAVQKLYIP